ncbi:MAG TPA: acyl-CoA dehydrogenase family protein [Acidobacteriota bacterium]|nr:acyl-CoA dehydrogenase family protein [Acidobacteriota bacterium]
MDQEQRKLAEELFFSGPKTTSFAKLLYFGIFDASRVFPYPAPSSDEAERTEELVRNLDCFLQSEVDPDWIDRNATIPDRVIAGLGKLGLMGLTIPKEYGGLGMSQYAYCRAMERVAARCGSTALMINAHQSIGLKALVLYGTEEQKARWLPPLARGEQLAAFSLTEPNAGSDVASIETEAVYDPARKLYRITGRKQWTTNGAIAGVLTVMAKTTVQTASGSAKKVTAFLVTPDMPGFRVLNPALEKVGMRGTKTANLAFEGLEVPASHILGPPGQGLRICLTVLDFGRTTFGATCTGASKFLLRQAVEYSRRRRQFGRPLASFALVKQKIANMAALVYAMESMTYLTAGMIDANAEDFMLEAAILKVFASDALWSIVYDTMQIFGGRSFFTDLPYERMMRDARLNMIGEGSNEVMRAFIGAAGMRDPGVQLEQVLKATRHPLANASFLWGFGRQNLARLRTPVVPVRSRLLKPEARMLAARVRRFGISVVRVLAKYQEEVVERQMILDRIASSAMALYGATAVMARLDRDLAGQDSAPDFLKKDLAAGRLFCRQAFAIVDRSLGSLFRNEDDSIERVSNMLSGVA